MFNVNNNNVEWTEFLEWNCILSQWAIWRANMKHCTFKQQFSFNFFEPKFFFRITVWRMDVLLETKQHILQITLSIRPPYRYASVKCKYILVTFVCHDLCRLWMSLGKDRRRAPLLPAHRDARGASRAAPAAAVHPSAPLLLMTTTEAATSYAATGCVFAQRRF